TFVELLRRVRRTALAAYAHQDLPFEQVVDALVTERDRSRTPLFQVFFNYAPQESAPAEAPDPIGSMPPSTVRVKFDLAVMLGDAEEGLTGRIEYSTALFDATTAERMAVHLTTLLEAVAADAGQHLSQLPVLTAAERDQVIHRWNDTEAPPPRVGGVPELIA